MPHPRPRRATTAIWATSRSVPTARDIFELTVDLLTVKPGPNSVVGKAVIFHEKADDLTTQPTGNAGGRFGCGVMQ